MTSPGLGMLGSVKAGGGPGLALGTQEERSLGRWPWAGPGTVTPLPHSCRMHLVKQAVSWSCKTKGKSGGPWRSLMYWAELLE